MISQHQVVSEIAKEISSKVDNNPNELQVLSVLAEYMTKKGLKLVKIGYLNSLRDKFRVKNG
jgi:hypothetical protein